MVTIVTLLFAMFALVSNASAYDGPTDYRAVLKECGTQWRGSDVRKSTPKGEGMAAWQSFRRECVKNSGYVSKRNRNAAN